MFSSELFVLRIKNERLTKMDNERKILSLLKRMNGQLISLEEGQEKINQRLGFMETRLNSLETRFDSFETRFDSVETKFDSFEK